MAPSNDLCTDAIDLECGPHSTDVTPATSTGTLVTSCGGALDTDTSAGVWYRLAPAADSTVVVTVSNAQFDVQVAVLAGGCDVQSCVAGGRSSTARGTADTTEVMFVADGGTYLVYVSGVAGSAGTMTVSFSAVGGGK